MKMIINGKYVDASNGATIEVRNPYNGELVDTVPSATYEDAQACLEAAYKGKTAWANTPIYDRVAIIRKFAANLAKDLSVLGAISSKEMGKPIGQANIEAWCLYTIAESYAEKAMHMYDEIMPKTSAGYAKDHIMTVRDPLGVVCCILPFNFPIYIAAHKVIPALLMGNAVILKPSSSNPLALMKMTEMLHEAGVPGEALHVITGSGATLGDWLVDSDKINAVAFTGSTETGMHIAEHAAKNLHHVMLECGGNDPFIVCEDADVDLAVKEAIAGRLSNGGQVCCSPKRFLVNKAVKKEFTEKLLAALKTIKPGDPADPATFVGTLIDAKAASKCEAQVQHTVDQGAELLLGGKAEGAAFYPALLDKVTPDMDIANNMEVFGACLPIIEVESDEEAVKIANQTRFGLSGAVFSKDLAKATRIAAKIEAGSVVVNGNDSNNRHPYEAFGGYKLSGYGREGVGGTLEEMSQVKTIVVKNFWAE